MEASEALSWSLIHWTTVANFPTTTTTSHSFIFSLAAPRRARSYDDLMRACAEGRADRERQRSRRVRDIPFMLFLPSFPFVPLLQTCMNFLKLDESVT